MLDGNMLDELRRSCGSGRERDALERLAAQLDEEAATHAAAFLTALASAAQGLVGDEFGECFARIAEQHICRGAGVHPESDLVRIVPAVSLLVYYSRKFVLVEQEARQQRIEAELSKIRAILPSVTAANLQTFLDSELNLNGRLRRRGFPLWLTPGNDIADCSTYADYARALGLEDSAASPAFRLQIGLRHLGETPNVHVGEPDHNPDDTMSVHEPTHVDGMHYDTFTPGGLTAGGTRESVSKLNNTQAIDRVEMIE